MFNAFAGLVIATAAGASYTIFVWSLIFLVCILPSLLSKKNKGFRGEKIAQFKDDLLQIGWSGGETNYQWSAIKRFGKTRRYMYLYIKRNMAVVIPRRAFEDETSWNTACDFAFAKIREGTSSLPK